MWVVKVHSTQGVSGKCSTDDLLLFPLTYSDLPMTIDKAREIIKQQISFGSGYNRNAVRLLLGEIQREYGLQAGDQLIEELNLEQVFGLHPGTDFTHVAH